VPPPLERGFHMKKSIKSSAKSKRLGLRVLKVKTGIKAGHDKTLLILRSIQK
jgi:hypothetical protein